MSIVEIVSAVVFFTVSMFNGSGNYRGPKDKGIYLSIYGGTSKSSYDNAQNKIAHGGTVGYFITDNFDLGLEALTMKSIDQISSTTWEYTEIPVLLKADYYSHLVPGFYIGARVGRTTRDLIYDGQTSDPYQVNVLSYGGKIGYEYTYYKGYTVGINALYLHLDGVNKTFQEAGSDISVSFKESNYMIGLLEFKYYF